MDIRDGRLLYAVEHFVIPPPQKHSGGVLDGWVGLGAGGILCVFPRADYIQAHSDVKTLDGLLVTYGQLGTRRP